MTTFALENIEEVIDNKLTFRKVTRNGKCLFDEFCQDIYQTQYETELKTILSYMNLMAEYNPQLPSTKFNSIKKKGKVVGYEFKTKHLRVYVVKKNPAVWVVLGGYKNTQAQDIRSFNQILDEMKLVNYQLRTN